MNKMVLGHDQPCVMKCRVHDEEKLDINLKRHQIKRLWKVIDTVLRNLYLYFR